MAKPDAELQRSEAYAALQEDLTALHAGLGAREGRERHKLRLDGIDCQPFSERLLRVHRRLGLSQRAATYFLGDLKRGADAWDWTCAAMEDGTSKLEVGLHIPSPRSVTANDRHILTVSSNRYLDDYTSDGTILEARVLLSPLRWNANASVYGWSEDTELTVCELDQAREMPDATTMQELAIADDALAFAGIVHSVRNVLDGLGLLAAPGE